MTANGETILQMRGIGKSFSGVRVLENVGFTLRAGEVHVLAGENGAGKSTLIKILAGVHPQYEGEIVYLGRARRFKNPQDAAAAGIAVIHQELSLIPAMSVVDNIFLGREQTRRLEWLDKQAQARRARELLAQLDLDVNVGDAIERYSLSIQQMIEISKALAFESRIIVMDEPTSALTEPEVERLFAIIAELKQRGVGIVYITHKMEEIDRIADRITVLRDGRHVGTAETKELPHEKLIHWMVGREITEQFPRHEAHPGDVLLSVEDLSLPDPSGAPRLALDDIAFEVRAGEILGLGGLQGSGNSELLNAIFGTYGRIAGARLVVEGKEARIESPANSIERGIALLTNDRKTSGLVLNMSIVQNTTLAAMEKFSPRGWIRPGAERAAARAQADRLNTRAATLEQPVSTLSGGNQQKVVLGKWLEIEPKILLLDEPTRGVDVGAKHEIYELMNHWTQAGMAIVLVSSEMSELLAMADRILVMHRGRITAEYDRAEATQEKILRAAMGEVQMHG